MLFTIILQLLPECHPLVNLLIAQPGLFPQALKYIVGTLYSEFECELKEKQSELCLVMVGCVLNLFWTEYTLNDVDILSWELWHCRRTIKG